MAETENGHIQAVDTHTVLLQELLGEVRELGAIVASLHEEFRRYSPILEAYLRPDSGGVIGWAVRSRQKKAEQHGH